MAEASKSAPEKAAEKENAEVEKAVNEHLARGYIGEVPDPNPNDAYSIKTGPESPGLAPDDRTLNEQAVLGKGETK